MDEWYRQALPTARRSLATFPVLNTLLDGFGGYESKGYRDSRNFVLMNCLPAIDDFSVKEQLEEMVYYEKALATFEVLRWPTPKLENLKSRMQSDEFDVGLTAYTEFMVAQRLVDAMGKKLVTLYPTLSNDKVSDVLVANEAERVYVEIGNLSESLPEKIIGRILNAGAAHLGPRITENRYFQVEVETANMVFESDGDIDEAGTIAKLKQEIDDLALVQLVAQDGLIDIKEAAAIYASLAVYQNSRRFMAEDLGKIVDSFSWGPMPFWARMAKFDTLNQTTMVQSVISAAARSPLVGVHTKGFYPSRSAQGEMVSFANHIVRHCKTQIASGQLELGAANIILVQGYNWMVRTLAVEEAVRHTIQKITEYLNASRYPDLFGVGFFSSHPEDGYFIRNPSFGTEAKLGLETVKALRMKIFW